MKRSKWTKAKIKKLLQEAQTCTNRSAVFSRFAREINLKPNSVRNFYYKNINAESKKSFEKFTELEIRMFLRRIILGYSRGESVRSICLEIAKEDTIKMLRYQNKYRSLLQKNISLVEQISKELESEGYIIKCPVGKAPEKVKSHDTRNSPDNVVLMPANYNALTDQDIQNLFMGFIRLVRKQGESQIEKLKREIELLKHQILHTRPSEH